MGVYNLLKNMQIDEIPGIIVFHEDSLDIIDFQTKCLEITTYAKTPMKKYVYMIKVSNSESSVDLALI